jgi:serine/threonine protein kinase
MELSVEQVCQLLERSRLLAPAEIAALCQRWAAENREPGRGAALLRWLVKEHRLTEYQANLLARGQVTDCFIGSYRVLERLTRGPLAGAYRVATPQGQVVALQLLPADRAQDKQILERFYRQVKFMQSLQHPHLVRIYQAGESQGRHYLVFEYLEGETLEEVLRRRQHLPLAEAGRLLCQVLDGVQYLHEHGRRHGDLRPATLLLTPPRAAGEPDTTLTATVKLLHAGLNWQLFWGEEPTALPIYQAPEQRQRGRRVDQRADIYSLGCILYHCLAGQPFTGASPQDAEPAALLQAVRRRNPQAPDGLGQVLAYMLAPEPEQRYATAERAAQTLQMFLLAERPGGGAPLPSWLTGEEQQESAPVVPAKQLRPAAAAAAPVPGEAETTVPLEAPAAAPGPPAGAGPAPLLAAPAPAAPPGAAAGGAAAPVAGVQAVAVPAPAAVLLPAAPAAAPAAPPVVASVPPAAPSADGGPVRAAVPLPAAQPLAGDWDVELISLPPQPPKRSSAWRLSPRDWFFLGMGAGATVLAMLLGMVLAVLLR